MKKITSILLICLLVLTNTCAFAVENIQNDESSSSYSVEVDWYDLAWKVINYASNAWYNRTPTKTSGNGYTIVSSGDIGFNNGTYGPTAYHNVTVSNQDSYIEMWAQTDILHWLNKIALVLYDPSGDEIKSVSAEHNQRLAYGISSDETGIATGTYKAQYVSNDSLKWDLWLELSNYASSRSKIVTATKSNDVNNSIQFYRANDKMYSIPKRIANLNDEITLKSELSMKELSSQIYDEEINTYVYDFKDFNVGDNVNFKDTILDVYYNENMHATIFLFKDQEQENVAWAFNGDLTGEYSTGDFLELNFTVVEEYSDNNYTFETLDYIKEGLQLQDKNIYPCIDKYIDIK